MKLFRYYLGDNMVYYETGAELLRNLNIDSVIKGISDRTNLLKQVLTPVSTGGWQNRYFKESVNTLNATRGLPRGASFPVSELLHEEQNVWMEKYGHEVKILLEDVISSNINQVERHLLGLASDINRVTDNRIYSVLSAAGNFEHTTGAVATWDNATRSSRVCHEDFAVAIGKIEASNRASFKADTALVSPGDFSYVYTNDYFMDSFDATAPKIMQNGRFNKALGLNFLVSQAVTADEAMVAVSKVCGNWFALQGLKSVKTEDPGVSFTIRAWEFGVPAVVQPYALAKITNTRA